MSDCKKSKSGNPAMKFVVDSGSVFDNIGDGNDCTMNWHLRLEEFAFPQVGRVVERLEGSYGELREQLHAREQAIQGISLDLPAAAVSADDTSADPSVNLAETARVQASIPRGRCPYCGHEQELDYDSWYLLGSEDELNPCADEDLSEYLDRRVSFEQLEGRTFHKLRDCPAAKPSKLSIAAGFESDETPLAKLERCLEHPRQSDGFGRRKLRDDGMQHAWWRIGALGQGYCKCNACGNYYHVAYGERAGLGHADYTPLLEQHYVDVDIVANDEAVTVHFEPAIGFNKCSDLRFGVKDGTFEVNGALVFGPPVLPAGEGARAAAMLDALPDDFECVDLFERIADLLIQRVEGFEEGLYLVPWARGASFGQSLIDIAVANRFRGYPGAFYLQVYEQTESGRCGTPKVRVNASVLPVNYADLEECFEQSCLPDTPEVRKAAFEQPWLIALAHRFKSMPFKDERVVERLLADKLALDTLTPLVPFDSAEGTILGYLCEKYGEDVVCGLLTCESALVHPTPWYGWLKRKMPAELPVEIREVLEGMPVHGAAYVLSQLDLAGGPDTVLWVDLEPFEYPEHIRALESEMGPAHLELPERPLDILAASVELGEDLAEYTQLMLEEDMNSCALLLARNDGGELVGAVAALLRKGVARLYVRRGAEGCAGLAKAFAAWAQERGLAVD